MKSIEIIEGLGEISEDEVGYNIHHFASGINYGFIESLPKAYELLEETQREYESYTSNKTRR